MRFDGLGHRLFERRRDRTVSLRNHEPTGLGLGRRPGQPFVEETGRRWLLRRRENRNLLGRRVLSEILAQPLLGYGQEVAAVLLQGSTSKAPADFPP